MFQALVISGLAQREAASSPHQKGAGGGGEGGEEVCQFVEIRESAFSLDCEYKCCVMPFARDPGIFTLCVYGPNNLHLQSVNQTLEMMEELYTGSLGEDYRLHWPRVGQPCAVVPDDEDTKTICRGKVGCLFLFLIP